MVSHWQLGLPLCASEGMVGRAHRSALTAVLLHMDAAVRRHSALRLVWHWQVGGAGSPAGRCGSVGAGVHTVVQGGLPRADGHWLSTALAEAPLQQCSGLQLLS